MEAEPHIDLRQFYRRPLSLQYVGHIFRKSVSKKNEFAVALTISKVSRDQAEFVSTSDFSDISNVQANDGLVVDCRRSNSFVVGHIPGAISLPANCKLTTLCQFRKRFAVNRKIIVYCENEHCNFANHVASLLGVLGYSDVTVYRPGWEGYLAHTK